MAGTVAASAQTSARLRRVPKVVTAVAVATYTKPVAQVTVNGVSMKAEYRAIVGEVEYWKEAA